MDWHIYEQVCIDAKTLIATGAYVTVNVSPVHLRDKVFAGRFLGLMERHQVEPQSFVFEVTEGDF